MKGIWWVNWLGLALILVGALMLLVPLPLSDDLRVAGLPVMLVGLVLGLLNRKKEA